MMDRSKLCVYATLYQRTGCVINRPVVNGCKFNTMSRHMLATCALKAVGLESFGFSKVTLSLLNQFASSHAGSKSESRTLFRTRLLEYRLLDRMCVLTCSNEYRTNEQQPTLANSWQLLKSPVDILSYARSWTYRFASMGIS